MSSIFKAPGDPGRSGAKLVLLLAYVTSVMAVMRAVDFFLLMRWPRLWKAYLRTWKTAYEKSPFTESDFGRVVAARQGNRSRTELTYGETPVVTARALLRAVGVTRESAFLDLGMGRGRVLIAALTLGARARGVDLVRSHVETTRAALESVGAQVAQQDAAKTSLEGASHIFLAWTCFSERSRKEVTQHLESAAPGTVVVCLDYPIESQAFEPLKKRTVFCSWGRANAFVSRRR